MDCEAKKLLDAYEAYSNKADIKPGDLVRWKPGMKNKPRPKWGQQMVVLKVEEGQVDVRDGTGSAYYGEDLSIRAGFFDEDEEFFAFWFDAHRLEVCNP